ncbi:MAG: hypothetical protein GY761_12610 [Hyphomicrobiales bacterium]|nr:hypothetical protein [Hyphomicrobiales bacterium]
MARLKVLAIAVATGRIGYVFFDGDVLKDWKLSKKASKSPTEAKTYVTKLIAFFKPDVVVTERIDKNSRKGDHAKRIITTIAKVAENHELLDVSVPRLQAFKNKYEEARELVLRFPDLRPRLPKEPRIWQSEPFGTIYFEALALALLVIDRRVAN